eukprot:UN28150
MNQTIRSMTTPEPNLEMYGAGDGLLVNGDPNKKTCCRGKCTNEVKILVITMILFGTITAAQTFAALAANSLALLGDCASMLIDTLSYAGNIAGECSDIKDERKKMRNQLIASGASLTVLIAITGWIIQQSITSLYDSEDDDDVNAWIVF